LWGSGGDLESNSTQQCVQIVAYALIDAVEFTAFLFRQNAISAEGLEQTRGEGRVDVLEQLEKSYTVRKATQME